MTKEIMERENTDGNKTENNNSQRQALKCLACDSSSSNPAPSTATASFFITCLLILVWELGKGGLKV